MSGDGGILWRHTQALRGRCHDLLWGNACRSSLSWGPAALPSAREPTWDQNIIELKAQNTTGTKRGHFTLRKSKIQSYTFMAGLTLH